MISFLPIVGVIFLIFRLWLCEIKLVSELQFRNRYLSRLLSYILAVSLICELNVDVFNLILVSSIILMIVSILGWDLPFFIKFKKRKYWTKNFGWLKIERISLHPPILFFSIYIYVNNIHQFINRFHFIETLFAGIILVYGLWFLLDERWKNRALLPETRWQIPLFMFISLILVVGFYFFI